ncbi:Stk1 family PASTA domain-containing Ser/Thr kinase [Nocardioides gansuensis]|uniref:non-specific serine/threonine protein kinase n=1 Tax=Nocardioides gansuensis TaxID=2138300 RepID=A0A2T8FGH0_9ACTN|nr:Stk1 family PASTA domain-containing Ser/Thr kinase [Nocardioides gansuensis]PVG84812.1 Stk1 family PASTA domain-containing Ser/Thr kinase [Nocardioides gansuensis]
MSQSEPTIIGGRYQLGELLGRGGMAEVRKGVDTRLGRTVAVKRLRTDLASDATFQARFRREAQSSASLNHPAIVSVYDTGEEMATDGSDVAQPYIVMECVTGRTLRDILREGRKILPERALEITSGVLSALDYSHRAGIIHRDIKPANVMLTPTGDVKVMDFGIARAVSDASSTMTQTAAVVGTAQYLSPEQARGETVDSRSDVYSTGCLLFELLTGRPPFVGDSPVAVAYQHVREQPVPPSDFDDQLDPEIDAIVLRALAKRVEDRYQSAAAMRADIERYLAGHPIQAGTAPVVPPDEDASERTTTMAAAPSLAPTPDEPESRGGRTGLVVLLALLLIGGIALAAYLLPRMFEQEPEEVPVPNLIGLTEADARLAIADAELTVGNVRREPSDTVPVDQVIEQDPNRDIYVAPDTAVDFVVSTGRQQVEIPVVAGQPVDVARQQLEALELRVQVTREESDEPADEVLRTDPAAGQSVAEGATVEVFVSDGPETVPSVVGKKEQFAIRALERRGFAVEVAPDLASTEPRGTVVRQNPEGGSTADSGATVIIFVSVYEPPTETPTPTPTETPLPTETPTPTETVPPTETPTTPVQRRR